MSVPPDAFQKVKPLLVRAKESGVVVIGLVGLPAAGKTTVSKLASLYADVICVDRMIPDLLESRKDYIIENYGDQSWRNLNDKEFRKAFSGVVFSDEAKMQRWEKHSFPLLMSMVVSRILASTSKIVVIDYALLNYAEMDSHICDFVICVDASSEVRMARAAQERNWADTEMKRREDRFKHTVKGDIVLMNDEGMEELTKKVDRLFSSMQKLSGQQQV